MLTWDEWERLVIDAQEGNKDALIVLLKNSRLIIEGVVKRTAELYRNPLMFSLSPEDIFQEIAVDKFIEKELKCIKKEKARAYVRWLKEVTKNHCLNVIKRMDWERRIEVIEALKEVDSREEESRNLSKL